MYYFPTEPRIAVAALSEKESFLNKYGLYIDLMWAKSADKLHYHDYFQLYYTVSGKYYHTINGVTKACTAGDVSLIMPYTVHALNTIETDYESTWVISVSILPDTFYRKNLPFYPVSHTRAAYGSRYLPTSMQLTGEDKLCADELMRGISAEHGKRSDMFLTKILKKLGLFFEICASVSGVAVPESTLSAQLVRSKQIYDAAARIKKNRTEKLVIEDAARRATMSRSTFTKNFREVVGMTYHDLLLSIRMALAVQELRYTRKSIAEIAVECGFSSNAHFTKACIGMFSLPPHPLRRRMAELTRRHSEYLSQRDRENEWARLRAAETRREHFKASIGEL